MGGDAEASGTQFLPPRSISIREAWTGTASLGTVGHAPWQSPPAGWGHRWGEVHAQGSILKSWPLSEVTLGVLQTCMSLLGVSL